MKVGNKQNSALNGEWAGHVRGKMKRITSHIRRNVGKAIITKLLNEHYANQTTI